MTLSACSLMFCEPVIYLQTVFHKLKYHFMTYWWQVFEKRKAWTGKAAVWLLTVDYVIIGTKFNNQTAENLAAMSNSPPCLELYPSPSKLDNITGAKCQIWSCFTKQTSLTPNQQHSNTAEFLQNRWSNSCFFSFLSFSSVVSYPRIKLLYIKCQNLWHYIELLQVWSNW